MAAVSLDGVPENIALGVSVGDGTGGIALLAGGLVSNMTEGAGGERLAAAQGRSQGFLIGTWTVCALLLTAAAVLGAGPLSDASPTTPSLHLATL